MARQVLPIVGAVIGAFYGNPQLGYAIGSPAGSPSWEPNPGQVIGAILGGEGIAEVIHSEKADELDRSESDPEAG